MTDHDPGGTGFITAVPSAFVEAVASAIGFPRSPSIQPIQSVDEVHWTVRRSVTVAPPTGRSPRSTARTSTAQPVPRTTSPMSCAPTRSSCTPPYRAGRSPSAVAVKSTRTPGGRPSIRNRPSAPVFAVRAGFPGGVTVSSPTTGMRGVPRTSRPRRETPPATLSSAGAAAIAAGAAASARGASAAAGPSADSLRTVRVVESPPSSQTAAPTAASPSAAAITPTVPAFMPMPPGPSSASLDDPPVAPRRERLPPGAGLPPHIRQSDLDVHGRGGELPEEDPPAGLARGGGLDADRAGLQRAELEGAAGGDGGEAAGLPVLGGVEEELPVVPLREVDDAADDRGAADDADFHAVPGAVGPGGGVLEVVLAPHLQPERALVEAPDHERPVGAHHGGHALDGGLRAGLRFAVDRALGDDDDAAAHRRPVLLEDEALEAGDAERLGPDGSPTEDALEARARLLRLLGEPAELFGPLGLGGGPLRRARGRLPLRHVADERGDRDLLERGILRDVVLHVPTVGVDVDQLARPRIPGRRRREARGRGAGGRDRPALLRHVPGGEPEQPSRRERRPDSRRECRLGRHEQSLPEGRVGGPEGRVRAGPGAPFGRSEERRVGMS